jgi:hypothetical protein
MTFEMGPTYNADSANRERTPTLDQQQPPLRLRTIFFNFFLYKIKILLYYFVWNWFRGSWCEKRAGHVDMRTIPTPPITLL